MPHASCPETSLWGRGQNRIVGWVVREREQGEGNIWPCVHRYVFERMCEREVVCLCVYLAVYKSIWIIAMSVDKFITSAACVWYQGRWRWADCVCVCVCLPQWRFIGLVCVYSIAVYVYSDLSTSRRRCLCSVTDVVKAAITGVLCNPPCGAELFLSLIPVIFPTSCSGSRANGCGRPCDFSRACVENRVESLGRCVYL